MGLRFRRSLRIAPGVRLNLGGRGASVTIGKRGASINVGRRGTYLNAGLPGTGLSYCEKLFDAARKSESQPSASGLLLVLAIAIIVGSALLY